MTQLIFVLDVRAIGVRAEFLINGVPVARVEAANLAASQTVINDCIRQGANRLEAGIALVGDQGHSLSYRVVRTFRAADAPEETLVQVERPTIPPSVQIPVLTDSFAIRDEVPRLAWEDPASRPITPADETALGAELSRLRAAFEARDVETILDMLKTKFERQARALQLPAAVLIGSAREQMGYLFASADFSLTPLPLGAIGWRFLAEGKLAMPFNRVDGGPAIHGTRPAYLLEPVFAWLSAPVIVR